jgi:hypothetical protein
MASVIVLGVCRVVGALSWAHSALAGRSMQAYTELLARIASNDVAATANYEGKPVKLDGFMFASIRVSYPLSDTPFDMTGNELYLCSYAYADDEHWHKGLEDSLDDRNGRQWTKIMVAKPDVARWWPFVSGHAEPETHSGGAGRPSAMHLVEAEYERRRALGELNEGIGKVSATLAAWARTTYPEFRTPGAGAIENSLRERHRKSKASTKSKFNGNFMGLFHGSESSQDRHAMPRHFGALT